jgi:phage major head subunit gpT-like protein
MVMGAAAFLADQAAYQEIFDNAFMEAPSTMDRVAMVVPSKNAVERFAWTKVLPSMREWIGPRQLKSMAMDTTTVVARKWEGTISLEVSDIEDDSTGMFRLAVQGLGEVARANRDQQVWDYLTGDAWTVNGYDGVPLFSAAHPTSLGGVQANTAAAVALAEGTFETAWLRFAQRTNDEGRVLGIQPDLLVCGPQNRVRAETILLQQYQATGETNLNYRRCDLLVDPHITGTHWFLVSTRRAIKPIVFTARYAAPQFAALDQPSQDTVFLSDEVVYGAKDRFGVDSALWHFIDGNEGA